MSGSNAPPESEGSRSGPWRRLERVATAVSVLGIVVAVGLLFLGLVGYEYATPVGMLLLCVSLGVSSFGWDLDLRPSEKTWFDRALDDHLLLRDCLLVAIVFVPWVAFVLLMGVEPTWALGTGVAFTVVWVAWMELLVRRDGWSLFRYWGGDPFD